eukprot:bmy_05203T0
MAYRGNIFLAQGQPGRDLELLPGCCWPEDSGLCRREAAQHTQLKEPGDRVLCPALRGPRASPFLSSEEVTLEQWSSHFVSSGNTVQRQSYLQLT